MRGPTKQMIETGRRMQEIPGLPQVKFGKAEPFFDRLAARVKGNPRLPVVDGELYLSITGARIRPKAGLSATIA